MRWSRVWFWKNEEVVKAVVPSNWIKHGTLLWRHGVNATKALKEKRQPSDDWKNALPKALSCNQVKRKLFLSEIILCYVKMNFTKSFV